MINNLESYNKAQLIELVKTQIEEYQKLDKDHASLKKFVNFQGEVVDNSEKEIAELEQNLGLIKLGIEQQHKQLISCETALDERNDKVSLQASRIAELEKEIEAHERNDAANYKIMDDSSKQIAGLEKERDALIGLPFKTYKTEAAESLAGIALRQLGNEKLWVDIARLNSLKFPDVSANDYYPVGTILIMPNQQLLEAHNLEQQAKGIIDLANGHQGQTAAWMLLQADKIIEKAKQLREGVK